ncbi:hypothetical protein G9P44_005830 [Scheffersomyces stipitis]|nr:hypothetical protein G9P44_005830 [Scheffersomyces stipitis]
MITDLYPDNACYHRSSITEINPKHQPTPTSIPSHTDSPSASLNQSSLLMGQHYSHPQSSSHSHLSHDSYLANSPKIKKRRASYFPSSEFVPENNASLAIPDDSAEFTTLVPITSPPDDRSGVHQYPSQFFLSPITSNDSTVSENEDNIVVDDSQIDVDVEVTSEHNQEPLSPASSIDSDITDVQNYSQKSFVNESFSPLLSLPLEILYRIIEIVYYDNHSYNSINSNLETFSQTVPLLSKKFHQLSLCFLYKYAIFNRPHSFDKFLHNLKKSPQIGMYVEFMDFQQFTSIGLGRTGRMNQEIQMVTSRTISKALSLTPNLMEFLASENIQDDMDVEVLNHLFNRLGKIRALDFCGASSENFVKAFQELVIYEEDDAEDDEIPEQDRMIIDDNSTICSVSIKPARNLSNLTKVSFHDCSNLTPDIFSKVLPHLINLKRLDLNHTSITSTILLNYMPTSIRLTHLSLARCSKLTTRDLIKFITVHPAVSHNSLQWLNLQIDSNVVSPLTDVYLLYTLKHLNAPDLRYVNLGGMPVGSKHLPIIKHRFPNLESLAISHSSVNLTDIQEYMKDNTQVKFLDLTGIKQLTRFNLLHILKSNFNSSLRGIEFDYKILYDLTSKGEFIKVTPVQTSFIESIQTPQVWKFYDNEGRRSWIYKLAETDSEYRSIMNGRKPSVSAQSNLVYYDLETGSKISTVVKKPDFLKFASRKINCSIGYYNLNKYKSKNHHEDVWPVEFSQRGIYNYYSLNLK